MPSDNGKGNGQPQNKPQDDNGRGDGGRLVTAELLPEYGQSLFRGQCRDVVEILQFKYGDGKEIFTAEEAAGLIRKAGTLAAQAAAEGHTRNYRAAMQVIYTAARIQQQDRPMEHEHHHDVVHDFGVTLEKYRAEAVRRGLIEVDGESSE